MNDAVERDWQTALDVLQPSPKDLDHGLQLHRESLVFESYGFSPRAAVDGDALAQLQQSGASDEELGEANEEMFLARMADHEALAAEYHAALDHAGVDCILQNAGEECQAPLQLIKRLANFTYVTDMLGDFMQRVATPAAIEAAHAAGRHGLYMSANGVPLAQRWKTPEEELRYVRVLFQLGVRMMHITYNRRNMLGDGCQEVSDAGLSDFGRTAIAELNRVGVIADVAHSGWQTGIDTAEASSVPVVASHSGAWALSRHPRCKSDEVMKAIAATGGTVGACCIPAFLGGTGDIAAFLDHVDYMVKLIGAEHVTIGTDNAYVSAAHAGERAKLGDRPARRTRFEGFWQPDDEINNPAWREPRMRQSLAWTNWPLLTVGMVQRGHSDDDIRKILGENILRVAHAVFDARQPL